MAIRTIVERAFIFKPPCYVHCQRQASFIRLVDKDDTIMGAYICPGNFVSRIVYFSAQPDLNWFRKQLEQMMVDKKILDERDIRIATRHEWEIEKSSLPRRESLASFKKLKGLAPYVVREVYWVYPRQKMLDEKEGIFRCSNCGKIFVQPLEATNTLCKNCA